MKKIPIGYSDFKRIRTTPDFLYVDKTALIEEFLEDPAQILLITRPRRFEKTLNLSTLRYFFDQENAHNNRKLFESLKVSQIEKRQYEQELRSQGATKIMKIGIGFLGKNLEFCFH